VGKVNIFVFVLPMDGDIVVDMIANSDDDSVALLDTDRRSWELIVHSHNSCRVAQPHYSCVFHLLTNYYQHIIMHAMFISSKFVCNPGTKSINFLHNFKLVQVFMSVNGRSREYSVV